ncbi:MAG: bifunctional phosphoglucose/phosphomannose isomerase [Bacteroidetes bacterium]|nr:bifunctional phosphoglucose/phosphomannose isomerase [Bacteroidota bacterium]
MKTLVAHFSKQLQEALSIAQSANLSAPKHIHNVLITGLGGSGIGGTNIIEMTLKTATVPVLVSKDYFIPNFVNENTLVVVCSYSGNTEETISAMQQAMQRKAQIACITSGGKIKELAQQHHFDLIIIPGGHPPRSCMGYSLVQLMRVFDAKKIAPLSYQKEIENVITLLDKKEEDMKQKAMDFAKKLHGKIPVIYSLGNTEGLAIRFRQQMNENSKMLCWHHVIPEMNHNELVGWAGGNHNFAVCVLRTDFDYERNVARLAINKEIIAKYTDTVFEIKAEGGSAIEQAFYLIHLTDWISCYLADLKNIDPMEINVINHLKDTLAKKPQL